MKRSTKAIALVVALPLILFALQYAIAVLTQPEVLYFSEGKLSGTSYILYDENYELTGNIHAFPGQIISPEYAKDRIDYTHISSLSEMKTSQFLVDNSYVGTLYFALNLLSNTEYSIWMPSEFTEYKLYVNGELSASSRTWESNHPAYPGSYCVRLPATDKGYYDIVIQVRTHKDYVNTASSHMLISIEDKLFQSHENVQQLSIIFSTFIVISIILALEQILAFAIDKRLISFAFLSAALLVIMSVDDERIVTRFIPGLPFEIGCFVEAIMPALFLVALMLYTYSMYPENFSKKLQEIFVALLLIPVINGLTLMRYPIIAFAAKAISIIPYAVFIYVFIITFDKEKRHVLVYGLGVLFMEASVLLAYSTSDLAIPSRYTYTFGYCIFAFMMVATIAGDYTSQSKEEHETSSELSKKLDAMQASENAFLNAQMKPHFLYNTLNTIADCCVTDSQKAKKLISSLSDYLKHILTLNSMDKTVPLRTELELVEAYTAIEKERFPSISFYNDFPLEMPDITIPPITLQSIIENAIKHGVRKSDKPGLITLRIIEGEKTVDFFVSDNGAGMDSETISKLFRKPKENQSIGIYNIDKRLHNIYGRGLKIESTPGLGTCVSFSIPKEL